MTYVLYGLLAAYLITGLILTRTILRAPRKRQRLRDLALGAVVMPVLFVALLVAEAFNKAWRRLMLMLDLKPPEEMQPGPPDPSTQDSGKTSP